MSLKLEAMASAVGLLCWAIRFPESTTAVPRTVHAGLASSRPPPAVAPPLISPQAPAGADTGSIAGPPHTETGDPGPELLSSTSTSRPVVTFAPGHKRSTETRATASCAPRSSPPPPAAPTGWRLTRRRTAGRSAPSRLPGAEEGEGRRGGPLRPISSLPLARWVAGLEDASKMHSITLFLGKDLCLPPAPRIWLPQ